MKRVFKGHEGGKMIKNENKEVFME